MNKNPAFKAGFFMWDYRHEKGASFGETPFSLL
jgi:hypothetical protein